MPGLVPGIHDREGGDLMDLLYKVFIDPFVQMGAAPDLLLQTLWDGLVTHYYKGTADVAKMQATWQSLAGRIDAQRHREVAERLQIQVTDAALWRDHILKYFQQFSQMPIVPPAQG